MKLTDIVNLAIKTYNLDQDATTVISKLKLANIGNEVVASDVSSVVDMVLQLSKNPKQISAAAAVYADLKDTSKKISDDSCPLCRTNMSDVQLASARSAKYCASCHVAMPVRVE